MKKDQRYYARLAKATKRYPYTYMADYIGISHSSMYNWLNYQFELSSSKKRELDDLLDILLDRIIV